MTHQPEDLVDYRLVGSAIYEASVRMTKKYGVTVEPDDRRSWLRVTHGFAVPDLGIFQGVLWRKRGSQDWREVVPVTRAANAVGAAIRAHSN